MAQAYTDLNPDSQESSRAFVDPSSRGTVSSKGGDNELFKGISDALGMTIKATDQYLKTSIQEQATAEVDQVRKEFGVEAASTQQKSITDPNQPVPRELREAGEYLDGLNKARQQGALKDSHYWARLESSARQLRARYPGYREHIDNTISHLTGATPANRLISELAQEALQTGKISEEQKFEREYIKQAEFKGLLPPDFYERKAKGIPYSFEGAGGLRDIVTKKEYVNAQLALKKNSIELENSTDAQKTKAMEELARTHVATAISDYTNSSFANLDQLKANAMKEITNTGVPSLATSSKIKESLAVVEAGRSTIVNKILNSKDYATLSPSAKEAIRKNIDDEFKGYTSDLTNSNWGILNSQGNVNKLLKDNAEFVVLKDAHNAALSAMRSVGGDSVANAVLSKMAVDNPNILSQDQARAEIAVLRAGTRYAPAHSQIQDLQTKGASVDAIKSTINTSLGLIADPKIPGKVREAYIENYFGVANEASKVLSLGKTKEDRMQLYQTWTNPLVAKNIKEYADSTGNTQVWNKYKKWTEDGFNAVFYTEVSELANLNANKFLNVQYNPKTYTFEMSTVASRETPRLPGALGGIISRTPEDFGRSADPLIGLMEGRQENLRNINKAISSMLPVWKSQGLDPNEEVGRIMSRANIHLGTSKRPGAIESMFTMVSDAVSKATGKTFVDEKFQGRLNEPLRLSASEIDDLQAALSTEITVENSKQQMEKIIPTIGRMLQALGYTPGPRESTNLEDGRNIGAGRFADVLLTQP